jgi:hypothetical protein
VIAPEVDPPSGHRVRQGLEPVIDLVVAHVDDEHGGRRGRGQDLDDFGEVGEQAVAHGGEVGPHREAGNGDLVGAGVVGEGPGRVHGDGSLVRRVVSSFLPS